MLGEAHIAVYLPMIEVWLKVVRHIRDRRDWAVNLDFLVVV